MGLLDAGERGDVAALEAIGPGGGPVEQSDQVQQRRLAGPRGSHHRDVLAGVDPEVEFVQRMHLAVAEQEHPLDAGEFDQRGRSGAHRRAGDVAATVTSPLVFDRHPRPGLHAGAVQRGDDAVALRQPVDDLGVLPVRQARLQLALDEAIVGVDHQHAPAFEQRRGRHAQHVLARVEHDLDVGAVADQQPARGFRVVEGRLDVHGARLLLDRGDVGRDPPHLARKRLAGQGVERDADELANAGSWARRSRPSAP